MEKNYYITKSEQMVYNAIKSAEIVSLQDIREMLPEIGSPMLKKILHSLESRGYLHRIKRGLYMVKKSPSDGVVLENPYRTALQLYRGYVAFSSALRIYGITEYEPFTIFIATEKKSGKTEIGEYLIRAVSMEKRATGMHVYRGIYVSTPEKTFFDCFYRPQYCGGYGEVSRALYEAKSINWREFLNYFESLASPSLCQRTGYVLDMLTEKDYVKVPAYVIKGLRKRVKSKTKLIPSAPSRGKFSSEWKLIDNLGKEGILGWSDGY